MSHTVSPVAVVVRFRVRAGRDAEFDDLVARTAADVRSHEPDTLVYAWHRVEDEPRDRVFYGLWGDRSALLAHAGQPHMRHFQDAREPLVESTHAEYLALADGKTPRGPGPTGGDTCVLS
jgi:quinol monooxygenase YgiN